MDGGLVLRLDALFDDVVGQHRVAAVRQVHVVAAVIAALDDPVAVQDGIVGAALDLVAHRRVVDIAVADGERADLVDIDIVHLAGTAGDAVPGKFGIVDADGAASYGRTQQPLLVVMDEDVDQGQVAAFVADPRTVVVAHLGAGDFDVAHRHVGVDDELRLAVCRLHGGDELRHAAHALDHHLLGDLVEVVGVGSGLHANGVAVLGCRQRPAQRAVLLSSTHGQDIARRQHGPAPAEFDGRRQSRRIGGRGPAPGHRNQRRSVDRRAGGQHRLVADGRRATGNGCEVPGAVASDHRRDRRAGQC